jgi:hypothetical protein
MDFFEQEQLVMSQLPNKYITDNTKPAVDWSLIPRPLIFDIIRKSTELKRKPFDSVMEELKSVKLPEFVDGEEEYATIRECIDDDNSVYSLRECWSDAIDGHSPLSEHWPQPLGVCSDHGGFWIDSDDIGDELLVRVGDCLGEGYEVGDPIIFTQELYNKGRLWMNRCGYETDAEDAQHNPENNTDAQWGWPGLVL